MKSYSDHTTTPINEAISELDAKQTAEIAVLTAKLASTCTELSKYKFALASLAIIQAADLIAQYMRHIG